MNFGSVCSGIEAASVAFPPHWEAKFYSEIEPFPCAILAKHYGCGRPDFMPSPNDEGLSVKDKRARQAAIKAIMKLPAEHKGVPNHGDMTQFEKWEIKDAIRLLCGGTPCQSFSIAGLRKGLDDQRGNLMLTYGEMAAKLRPDWLLWENVPGVLSSNKGKDFGAFLGLLSGQTLLPPKGGWGKAGIIPGYDHAYGLAYRVFDAQYFGVAQRRRRLFVVGYIGDWRPAAAVLLELDCVLGNPPPRREKRQEAACDAVSGIDARGTSEKGSHWDGTDQPHPSLSQSHNTGGIGQSNQEIFSQRGAGLISASRMVAFGEYSEDGTASAMKARDYKDATDQVSCVRERSDVFSEEIAHCLQTTCHDHTRADGFNMVAHTLKGEGFDASEDGTGRQNLIAFSAKDYGADAMDNMAPTLRAGNHATSHANSGSWVAVAQSSHALSLHENQRGEVTLNDTSGALSQGGGKPGQGYAAAIVLPDTLRHNRFHADAVETDSIKTLRLLREQIGEEALSEWGFRILGEFLEPEILRPILHGKGLRYPTWSRSWMVNCSSPCEKNGSEGALQSVRETGRERCSSQRWKPPEQFARELRAYLQKLSQPGASPEKIMRDLWEAAEGAGILRQALSTLKETRQSFIDKNKPAHGTSSVRRLVPVECEFLQGFPRNYTDLQANGKPTPDGPRYKSLGNSWAVPNISWIAYRIDYIDQILERNKILKRLPA